MNSEICPTFPPNVFVEEILAYATLKLENGQEICKIPNAFFIYLISFRKECAQQNIIFSDSRELSKVAAKFWDKEPILIKSEYKRLYNEAKKRFEELRQKIYPIKFEQCVPSSSVTKTPEKLSSRPISPYDQLTFVPQEDFPQMETHFNPSLFDIEDDTSLFIETFNFPETFLKAISFPDPQTFLNETSPNESQTMIKGGFFPNPPTLFTTDNFAEENVVIEPLENLTLCDRISALEMIAHSLFDPLHIPPNHDLKDRVSYLESLISTKNDTKVYLNYAHN
ncbi:hypothetical protein G9A89_007015 [Geosiphon pyriformis]|nr:hypothetical protein G9A89_007015 [Geosiphon pyriformis]